MNKCAFIAVVAACLFAGLVSLGAAAAKPPVQAAAQIRLTVTGADITARPELYGHNVPTIDWHGTVNGSAPILWDVARNRPDPSWEKLTHAYPLRIMRYHSGNNYAWRNVVGPLSERKPIAPSEHWSGPYRPEAGMDEFLRWLETLPQAPAAQLIASPFLPVNDIADLVAYCNATTGPMAELRARNGHPTPYNVRHWELGNETDWIGRADLDVMRPDTEQEKSKRLHVSEYIARCEERITAMRSVDPAILIYAHAQTSPWPDSNPDWRLWHQEVIKKLAGQIDAIVIHPYYDGHDVPYVLRSVDALIADIKQFAPPDAIVTRPLTVAITEHSRWINPDKRSSWSRSWGLQGAISAGDFLLRCMARPEISSANYWCYLHKGPWRVLNEDGGVKFGTGLQALFQLLNDTFLPRFELLVPTGIQPKADYSYAITAGLFSDPATGEKALVAINRSADQGATLTIKGLPVSTQIRRAEWLITADSLDATNVAASPDAVTLAKREAAMETDANGTPVLQLPPRSIAAWRWR